TGTPIINSTITISGNNSTVARSTDPGTPSFRLFNVHSDGALTLHDLTLHNGSAPSASGSNSDVGGALLNQGTLTLSNTTVVSNSAEWQGGGIYNSGTAEILNSWVEGSNSGGIFNGMGALHIAHSTVYSNTDSGIRNMSGIL